MTKKKSHSESLIDWIEEPDTNDAQLYYVLIYNGEFDPGSGRTLAAGLTHASRRGFRGLAL